MWILRGSGTDDEELVFRIPQRAIKTIGRAQGADIIVDAALVSRVHCRLEAQEDSLIVLDLAAILVVAATFAQVGPPEFLFHVEHQRNVRERSAYRTGHAGGRRSITRWAC